MGEPEEVGFGILSIKKEGGGGGRYSVAGSDGEIREIEVKEEEEREGIKKEIKGRY